MAVRDRIDLYRKYQAENRFTVSIDISRIFFYESTREPWGIKDLDMRYIYVNAACLELLNLPPDYDIAGKTFEEVTGVNNEFSEQIRYHEKRVIEEKHTSYAREIKILGADQKITPYIFRRMPYFSDIDTVCAIEFHGIPWTKLALIHSQCESMNGNILTDKIYTPGSLFSDREWEILYLYCTGLTKKHVAVKLNISEDRVKKCIQICTSKLADKLQIDTNIGIIPEIIKLGWLNCPPASLTSEIQDVTTYRSLR